MVRPRLSARETLSTYGVEHVPDDELVALVIGSGTRARNCLQLARDALAELGSMTALGRATTEELASLAGIGPAIATRLVAAFELGRRAQRADADAAMHISGPADVHARLAPRIAHLQHEVFVVLGLDVKNRVVLDREVARGTLTGVEVHPREVYRPLIRSGCASCVVAHNHPSGSAEPSAEDRDLTDRLRAIGELVGIPLLDHVVIAANGYTSIAEERRLPECR